MEKERKKIISKQPRIRKVVVVKTFDIYSKGVINIISYWTLTCFDICMSYERIIIYNYHNCF